MRGQGVIGRDCAWCGLPAVNEVEVQPAQYRTVRRVDPVSGARVGVRQLVQAAIVAPACDEHHAITIDQPAPVRPPRQRKARDVEQLDLFATGDEPRLRSAIYHEAPR